MPELPEVEVVRRGLESHALDRLITRVDVLHERPVRRDPAGASGFAASLIGRTFTAARRRGKYLWLPLSPASAASVSAGAAEEVPETGADRVDADALLGHLGMSGQMLVQPVGAPDEKHLRVRFVLEDGSELRFVDQRMFGGLSFSPGGAELPDEIAHIARDLLDPEFDRDEFVRRVRKRTSAIKRLLLDQNLVSGVGNIYADEALWRAGLHGERPGERLAATQVRELAAHAHDVMTEALAQGGTSFDALYVNVNGQSGYFERSLNAYGREDEPCRRCGTSMRRTSFMNRSSYFCPVCQKPPRTSR
ncbi:bifunctional DNA-formamidopyrimidine glycosylase/DNA-(apurinic or apyrimidinic site) lyase [Nocardioides cavernaquae]|uniref:Formamidopyrimidine-DNA glycosylase n=1 Tax=Nocardioides cavernaquae TaxID=2321396 RepID=A0A3A5H4Y0_9ACTN|nr:bifunctional DNA-formamidopyrimidine glycosylase/DNA-(apurinic or apyrimidinic site) lyase [Nocardioides cavernaquae]RJS44961.1 bifunctional DNA-formamidopyrimidine glycosylase/DNA-(apurinic or apyrimidinic site) lyase [Nocardioides cavernaquae]